MRRRTPGKTRAGKKIPKAQLRLPFAKPTEAERLVKELMLDTDAWKLLLTRNGVVYRQVKIAKDKLMQPLAKLTDLTADEDLALEIWGEILEQMQKEKSRPNIFADLRGPRGPDVDRFHIKKIQRRRGQQTNIKVYGKS